MNSTKFYTEDHNLLLQSLIDEVSSNDTRYLIPDLQRAYVWSPDRVVLLVDSLFRDWPFGSLLTWNYVTPEDRRESEYGIPARAFDRIVSRVKLVPHEPFQKRAVQLPQVGDIMVLDGQQRVQSLVLAFATGAGICLYDHDWLNAIHPDEYRTKATQHFTYGVLCVNLKTAIQEMMSCRAYQNLELQKILEWVAVDSRRSSHTNLTDGPLPCMDTAGAKYMPLSLLWSLAGRGNGFLDFQEPLRRELAQRFGGTSWITELGVDESAGLMNLMAIVDRFNGVRKKEVSQLLVSKFQVVDPQNLEAERDAYDQAIVSIFTRLNTAGRALTDAEITYAWLKVGWEKVRSVSGYPYPAQDFVGRVSGWLQNMGMGVDDNDVIDMMSMYWCVCKRGGKLLEARDYIRGDVIRPMAAFVYERAGRIEEDVQVACSLMAPVLEEGRLSSYNAVEVALAFFMICKAVCLEFMRQHPAGSSIAQEKPEAILSAEFKKFVDRWFYVTTFSGKWASGAVAYLADLTKKLSAHVGDSVPATLDAYDKWIVSFGEELIDTAKQDAIDNLPRSVDERGLVSQYANRLIAWQRIDQKRAGYRSLTFGERNSRARPKLQVDHVIAYAAWCQYIEQLFASADEAFVEKMLDMFSELTADEKSHLLLDVEKAREWAMWYAKAFINRFGNCSILVNRYNAAKSQNNMLDFMDLVYGFSQSFTRDDWAYAMKLTQVFLSPFVLNDDKTVTPNYQLQDYVDAIKAREASMLADLRKYVIGEKGYSQLF